MISIVNYGSGNIAAIVNILKQLKLDYTVSSNIDDLKQASQYILPGVGAFDPTMETLNKSGLVNLLNEEILLKRKPILGICVGMHLLSDGSDEGSLPGLGWISGRVKSIEPNSILNKPKLPHMGWNSINIQKTGALLDNINTNKGFYFLHNYYFDASRDDEILATVNFGASFPCVVGRANIYGAQFHPEKSHSNGLQLLSNFGRLS